MEFSVNGFIKRYCTPNALLTFAEYLEDYTSGETREKGWQMIRKELEIMAQEDSVSVGKLGERLERIKIGDRDILF